MTSFKKLCLHIPKVNKDYKNCLKKLSPCGSISNSIPKLHGNWLYFKGHATTKGHKAINQKYFPLELNELNSRTINI